MRDLDDDQISGDQRLYTEFESVLFTRYALLGFKIAAFGYAAGGFVGGEEDAILDERFSTNLGVGIRLNNPHLVIPTTELRIGYLATQEESEFAFYLRMKDVNLFKRNLPSVIPSVLLYQ